MRRADRRLLRLAQRAATSALATRELVAELRTLGLVRPLDSGLWVEEKILGDLAKTLAGFPDLVARGVPVLSVRAKETSP